MKKPFPHAQNFHSHLKFSFSLWNFHRRLKISIPGPVFLRPERGPEWKTILDWKFQSVLKSWPFSISPFEIEFFQSWIPGGPLGRPKFTGLLFCNKQHSFLTPKIPQDHFSTTVRPANYLNNYFRVCISSSIPNFNCQELFVGNFLPIGRFHGIPQNQDKKITKMKLPKIIIWAPKSAINCLQWPQNSKFAVGNFSESDSTWLVGIVLLTNSGSLA